MAKPPTEEELRDFEYRHVEDDSFTDGALCDRCRKPWPCMHRRLIDAYHEARGLLDDVPLAIITTTAWEAWMKRREDFLAPVDAGQKGGA